MSLNKIMLQAATYVMKCEKYFYSCAHTLPCFGTSDCLCGICEVLSSVHNNFACCSQQNQCSRGYSRVL